MPTQDWIPVNNIDDLPWEHDGGHAEGSIPDHHYRLPVGLVLKFADGDVELLGHDIGGSMTTGCSCCATEWRCRLRHETPVAYKIVTWE